VNINVPKHLDVATEFLEMFVNTIERTVAEEKKEPTKSFKPSSMNCSRRCYYQLTEDDAGGGAYRTFQSIGMAETGTSRHEYLQYWVMQMKNFHYPVEYVDVEEYLQKFPNEDIEILEKKGAETLLYSKKYNMRFMMDGIVKIRNKYFIIEFKTEISFKFGRRDGVDVGHYNQSVAYYLNFQLPIIFLYENRNDLDKKAYLFTPTEEQIDEVLTIMDEANKGVKENTVPPIPENIKSSLQKALDKKKVSQIAFREGRWQTQLNECRYCEFQAICMNEENNEKTLS
jgi:Iap family predicted aminopeptidase